jgi:hypothetical protein
MISSKYAGATALVVGLALVPTVIHSYLGLRVDEGVSLRLIPDTIEGMPSRPTERRQDWVTSRFDTDDWVERVYRVGTHDVTLFAGRSFDAKRVYHHPELALLRGTQTSPAGTVRLAEAPEIPLHVVKTARSRSGDTGVAVYVLIADGTFVENPIAYQLRSSARLLVSGRTPMTLVMATDLAGDKNTLADAPATRLLFAVLRNLAPRRTS